MHSPALDSVGRLRRIAAALEAGERPGPADGEWLASRLQRYIDGAALGLTIATALDLALGSSEPTWFQEEQRGQRDDAIHDLAARYYPSLRPGTQAREIERLALRYAASAWRHDRDRGALGERAEPGRPNACCQGQSRRTGDVAGESVVSQKRTPRIPFFAPRGSVPKIESAAFKSCAWQQAHAQYCPFPCSRQMTPHLA